LCAKSGETVSYTIENFNGAYTYTINPGDGSPAFTLNQYTFDYTYNDDGEYTMSIDDGDNGIANIKILVKTLNLPEQLYAYTSGACFAETLIGDFSTISFYNESGVSIYNKVDKISDHYKINLAGIETVIVEATTENSCVLSDDITIIRHDRQFIPLEKCLPEDHEIEYQFEAYPQSTLDIYMKERGMSNPFAYDPINTDGNTGIETITYTDYPFSRGLYEYGVNEKHSLCPDNEYGRAFTGHVRVGDIEPNPIVDFHYKSQNENIELNTGGLAENNDDTYKYSKYYWEYKPSASDDYTIIENAHAESYSASEYGYFRIINVLYPEKYGTNSGCEVSKEVQVLQDFPFYPDCGQLGEIIPFEITNYNTDFGLDYTFDISFGDGTSQIVSGPAFSHTYTEKGDFAVSISILKNGNLVNTVPKTVKIRDLDLGNKMYSYGGEACLNFDYREYSNVDVFKNGVFYSTWGGKVNNIPEALWGQRRTAYDQPNDGTSYTVPFNLDYKYPEVNPIATYYVEGYLSKKCYLEGSVQIENMPYPDGQFNGCYGAGKNIDFSIELPPDSRIYFNIDELISSSSAGENLLDANPIENNTGSSMTVTRSKNWSENSDDFFGTDYIYQHNSCRDHPYSYNHNQVTIGSLGFTRIVPTDFQPTSNELDRMYCGNGIELPIADYVDPIEFSNAERYPPATWEGGWERNHWHFIDEFVDPLKTDVGEGRTYAEQAGTFASFVSLHSLNGVMDTDKGDQSCYIETGFIDIHDKSEFELTINSYICSMKEEPVHFSLSIEGPVEFEPTSYLWTFEDGMTSDLSEVTRSFSENGVQTVTVQVDIDGCTLSKTKTIEIGKAPTLELSVDKRWCPGMTKPPTIKCTYGYDRYEWRLLNNPKVGELTGVSNTHKFIANNIGRYEVTAYAGICEITTTIEVEEFKADFTGPQCLDIRERFEVNTLANDAISWTWDFGQTINGQPRRCDHTGKRVSCDYLEADYYNIVHTASSEECFDESIKPINVGMSPEVHFDHEPLCKGQKSEFTDQSKGLDNYKFEWTFSKVLNEDRAEEEELILDEVKRDFGYSYDFTPMQAGEYYVELKVTNKCQRWSTGGKSVFVSEPVAAIILSDDGKFHGCGSKQFSFLADDQSDKSATSYTWSIDAGETETDYPDAQVFTTTFPTGQVDNQFVNLTVKNAGCTSSAVKSVYIHPGVTGNLLTNRQLLEEIQTCPSQYPTLSAYISNYDRNLSYSYVWEKDGIAIPFQENAPSFIIAKESGDYTLKVEAGCSAVELGTVTVQIMEITDANFTVEEETCPGRADGGLDLSFIDQVRQTFSDVNFKCNAPGGQCTDLPGGTYSMRMTYNGGQCYKDYGFTVPTHSVKVNDVIVQPNSCNGGSNGSITVVADPAYTYTWAHDGTNSSNTATDLVGGSYAVSVSDGSCTIAKKVDVTKPKYYAEVKASASCGDKGKGKVVAMVKTSRGNLIDGADYAFNWYNDQDQLVTTTEALSGPMLSNISIARLDLGNYKLKVVDGGSGCETDYVPFSILVGDAPSVSLSTEKGECGASNGTIHARVSGGDGPYRFEWSNGATGFKRSQYNLAPGAYSVTATDSRGCTAEASATVDGSQPLAITNFADNVAGKCGATISFTGGSGSYEIHWHQYAEDEVIGVALPTTNVAKITPVGTPGTYSEENLTPGRYWASVKDVSAEGCLVSTDSYIDVAPERDPLKLNVALRFVNPGIEDIPEEEEEEDPNALTEKDRAITQMFADIAACRIQRQNDVDNAYETGKWDFNTESLTYDELGVSFDDNRYQYTLYYYDRAGNLVRTVAPEGVKYYSNVTDRDFDIQHGFQTKYEYNSLNQLVWQETPDGGQTTFAYNEAGQLRFSQNAQQVNDGEYSYTKYDYLGRIVEVGQSRENLATVENYLTANLVEEAENETLRNFPTNDSDKEYVTYTVYSQAGQADYYGNPQRNLLNKVSYTYVDKDPDVPNDETYTYYSYDPHGNVEWLIQDVAGFMPTYVAYEYDLVSGNVLQVKYNENRVDRFFHRYSYDPDNRIEKVETSRDGVIWETDARYDYYAHGPLKRTEIGNDQIQGMDYVYNLQGWLKAVNHPELDATKDPGEDGLASNPFPTDVFGMTLGYHNQDFRGGQSIFEDTYEGKSGKNLYNGNIANWTYQTNGEDVFENNTLAARDKMIRKEFTYDQLNRLKKSYTKTVNNNSWQGMGAGSDIFGDTEYSFDRNGNIKSLRRSEGVDILDDFEYFYKSGKNQLSSIDETAPSNFDGLHGDLFNGSVFDANGAHKTDAGYSYDATGNLITDMNYEKLVDDAGKVTLIKTDRIIQWTPYGKVASVDITSNTLANGGSFHSASQLIFNYDATGNRVSKEVKELDAAGNEIIASNKKTYYLRDASGNILSVYDRKLEQQPAPHDDKYTVIFTIKEIPIYGSDRLGMALSSEELYRVPNVAEDEIDDISFDIHSMGINNKLYHWVTPRVAEVKVGEEHSECNCALEQLLYSDETDSYSATISNQFLGRAGNNVVVAENGEGQLKFYSVTAEKYLGNNDVALVLDRKGNLMKGSWGITSEHQAKGLALQNQGNEDLWYLLSVKEGQVYYTEINTAAQGYGPSLEDPYGEVTANKNIPLTPAGENFGRHMAAIEDGPNNRILLYMLRYNEPVAFNAPGLTDIVAYEIIGGDIASATETVLAQVEGLDDKGDGELQVSPDGNYLMLFNRLLSIGGFEHKQVDLAAMRLMPDMLTIDPMSIEHIETHPGGAWGKASADFSRDPVSGQLYQVAQQQSTVLTGSSETDKPFWQRIFSLGGNPAMAQNEHITSKGDIRQGKSMHVYVPGDQFPEVLPMTKPDGSGLQDLVELTPSQVNADGSTTTFADYLLQGGLPGQVLKIQGRDQTGIAYERHVGLKRYEMKDHLGNVRAVVTDRKLADASGTKAQVASVADYYPFGMAMPNRSGQNDELNNNGYRFGFNGMEKDDEIKGAGNSYDFGARLYDARIGRWLSMDPLSSKYPDHSPYTFVGNMVLIAIDPDGKKIQFVNVIEKQFTISGKTFKAWVSIGSADLNSNDYKTLINKIDEMRLKSESFDKLYEILDKKEEIINISINTALVSGKGAAAAQAPIKTSGENGLIVFKEVSNYDVGTSSAEFVISEEIFHQLQNILYEITAEKILEGTASRTGTEIEGEAKVFNKLVLDEIGIEVVLTPAYLVDLFLLESNPVSKLSQQTEKIIDGQMQKDYDNWIKTFETEIKNGPNTNHVYKGNTQPKTPEAINEVGEYECN